MELDYAILCQGATVIDGFMNLIGGGVANVHPPTIPGPVLGVTLAINTWMDRDELRRPHRIEIRFIDEDGRPIPDFPIPPPFDFPAQEPLPPPEPNPHAHIGLALVMPLHGIIMRREGNYAIDVLLDGTPSKRIPFRVMLAPGNPGQQPPNMPRIM